MERSRRQCAACGVLETTLRCRCQGALYCGKVCQKKSWEEHKKKCTWSLERQLAKKRGELGVDAFMCCVTTFELGEIYFQHAEYQSAAAHLLEGRRILKLHVGDAHEMLSESGRRLGQVYHSQGKYYEAGIVLMQAVRVIRNALQGAREVHITKRFKIDEGNTVLWTYVLTREDLAHTISSMASVHMSEVNHDLGSVTVNLESINQAERLYLEALQIYRIQPMDGDNNVAKMLVMLGKLYERYLDDDRKALECFTEALNLMRLPGKEPESALACTLVSCAGLCLHQEKFEEALIHIEEGIEIFRGIHREKHPNVSCALMTLSEIYEGMGKIDESLKVLQKVLKHRLRILGPDHDDVALCLARIFRVQSKRGQGNLAGSL